MRGRGSQRRTQKGAALSPLSACSPLPNPAPRASSDSDKNAFDVFAIVLKDALAGPSGSVAAILPALIADVKSVAGALRPGRLRIPGMMAQATVVNPAPARLRLATPASNTDDPLEYRLRHTSLRQPAATCVVSPAAALTDEDRGKVKQSSKTGYDSSVVRLWRQGSPRSGACR